MNQAIYTLHLEIIPVPIQSSKEMRRARKPIVEESTGCSFNSICEHYLEVRRITIGSLYKYLYKVIILV